MTDPTGAELLDPDVCVACESDDCADCETYRLARDPVCCCGRLAGAP